MPSTLVTLVLINAVFWPLAVALLTQLLWWQIPFARREQVRRGLHWLVSRIGPPGRRHLLDAAWTAETTPTRCNPEMDFITLIAVTIAHIATTWWEALVREGGIISFAAACSVSMGASSLFGVMYLLSRQWLLVAAHVMFAAGAGAIGESAAHENKIDRSSPGVQMGVGLTIPACVLSAAAMPYGSLDTTFLGRSGLGADVLIGMGMFVLAAGLLWFLRSPAPDVLLRPPGFVAAATGCAAIALGDLAWVLPAMSVGAWGYAVTSTLAAVAMLAVSTSIIRLRPAPQVAQ